MGHGASGIVHYRMCCLGIAYPGNAVIDILVIYLVIVKVDYLSSVTLLNLIDITCFSGIFMVKVTSIFYVKKCCLVSIKFTFQQSLKAGLDINL